jgi:DNA modification methylase
MIIHGNNIEILKKYPDNYFDAVVTDPPYGLGKEPDANLLLKDWLEHGYHEITGKGFMGKEWDAFVPQPLLWKEVFRVLKHGGHVVAFYGTRTYDWGVLSMRLAGFEIRDCIQWIYGCLSDDTEILTRSGYIQYHKFIQLPNFEQQEILIYDTENDIYKWEIPERWNQYHINKDTCYRIKSDITDQIVSRNHRCLVEREGKLVFIQAELLSEMEYMPTLSDDFFELQETKILQSSMQWSLSGSGMEETRTQGQKRMVRGNEGKISSISNRREEPILERWNNLSEKERVLFGSEIEVCEMPERIYSNGEERWICGGVSVDNGEAIGQTFIEDGVCASHRPQSDEQQYRQPDAICNEQRTQAVRMGRSYSTTLATITPIEYSGIIFCPTVSTGAFVARRNGKIFLTGNSGFPKSHNISKAIDKLNGAESIKGDLKFKGGTQLGVINDDNWKPKDVYEEFANTEEAKEWEGWGSALKPANEPIVLARKPLEKGLSIAENVLKWGTGGINIDGCRVSGDMGKDRALGKPRINTDKANPTLNPQSPLGRFPANIILTHHPECECKGLKKVGKGERKQHQDGEISSANEGYIRPNKSSYTHKDSSVIASYGEETIEDWNCHPECPIKIMDEQSGISKSNDSKRNRQTLGSFGMPNDETPEYNDKGGASRFFYVAKASKSERNKGLDGFTNKKPMYESHRANYENTKGIETPYAGAGRTGNDNRNNHPTVKPVKLMQYLARLITPPNGIVLDLFCGSGTTGVACKLEGFEFVGIEQDAEYCKIAEARIKNFIEEPDDTSKEIDDEQQDSETKYNQGTLF